MKILITGSDGFIGNHLFKYYQQSKHEIIGVDLNNFNKNSNVLDIGTKSFEEFLYDFNPEIVIHLGAIKDLSECEDKKVYAFKTNVLSTEIIAHYSKQTGAKIIYISSDVIFDGKKGNYKTEDSPSPLNWYGKTKVFSEDILKTVPNSAILRTALVIGKLNNIYQNILKEELKRKLIRNQTLFPFYVYNRLKDNKKVLLPTEIISNPTPIELLIESIKSVIHNDLRGTFHAAGPDTVSRYEFGQIVADVFDLPKELIIEDNSNNNALRPKNISLSTKESLENLKIKEDNWRLNKYIKMLLT